MLFDISHPHPALPPVVESQVRELYGVRADDALARLRNSKANEGSEHGNDMRKRPPTGRSAAVTLVTQLRGLDVSAHESKMLVHTNQDGECR